MPKQGRKRSNRKMSLLLRWLSRPLRRVSSTIGTKPRGVRYPAVVPAWRRAWEKESAKSLASLRASYWLTLRFLGSPEQATNSRLDCCH